MKNELEAKSRYYELKVRYNKLDQRIEEKANYIMNHPVIKEYAEFIEWTNRLIDLAKLGGQVEALYWILENQEE